MANRLARYVEKIYRLPEWTHQYLLTKLFCSQVKFANTASVKLLDIRPTKTVLSLANKSKVQNHIGGIHAVAAALLAESATGIVVGLNVPDSRIPLLKSMTVHYQRRMQGNLTAVATLSDEQQAVILSQEKGELLVAVDIVDESGQPPISCEMLWAWVPKQRS